MESARKGNFGIEKKDVGLQAGERDKGYVTIEGEACNHEDNIGKGAGDEGIR